jgi:hypothetical protein
MQWGIMKLSEALWSVLDRLPEFLWAKVVCGGGIGLYFVPGLGQAVAAWAAALVPYLAASTCMLPPAPSLTLRVF